MEITNERNTPKLSWKDVSRKWDAGETVWSAELGGLGPGYEQAIQILLFEILHLCANREPFPLSVGDKFSEEYDSVVVEAMNRLEGKMHLTGFTGAQVGAAKMTAYQFMSFGYEEMMSKIPDPDRRILVNKDFP